MGSWYDLTVDGFSIWGGKSYVEDEVLTLFQERDRRTFPSSPAEGEEEQLDQFEYAVPAHDMRERLDMLGFSTERAVAAYERGRAEHLEIFGAHDGDEWADQVVAQTEAKTFDRWQLALRNVVPLGYQRWMYDDPKWVGNADARMLNDGGSSSLSEYLTGLPLMLRGVLDALPYAKEVVLDYSHLVYGGYYEPDEPIAAKARVHWAATQPMFGPIVLLTEGKSDSRILAAALEAIAPHLAGFFSFLDFEAVKIQGSTDALAKMVRAFVGARVSTRMVAIFDNDAAGAVGLHSLSDVSMPPNMKAMLLPPNSMAKDYPTEGPQGSARMDVNGLAASIELYLGSEALRDGLGNLRPVRWTGYDQKAGRYQGAVENKHLVEKRFFDFLQTCNSSAEARSAFPELGNVVDAIATAFVWAGDT